MHSGLLFHELGTLPFGIDREMEKQCTASLTHGMQVAFASGRGVVRQALAGEPFGLWRVDANILQLGVCHAPRARVWVVVLSWVAPRRARGRRAHGRPPIHYVRARHVCQGWRYIECQGTAGGITPVVSSQMVGRLIGERLIRGAHDWPRQRPARAGTTHLQGTRPEAVACGQHGGAWVLSAGRASGTLRGARVRGCATLAARPQQAEAPDH